MGGAQLTHRTWILDILPGEVEIRCTYRRQGKRIRQFAVQLEIYQQGRWQPVVRYDNAHGFCHCDVIHPDGSQDKMPLFIGDANDTFTSAIKELRTHWQAHRDRYLKEMEP